MRKKVIGGKIEPKCEYCKFSIAIRDANTLLCHKTGVTEATGRCKKFRYDPLKRKPQKAPSMLQFTDQDFSLD